MNMPEHVAKVLEDIMGPLVGSGMDIAFAEKIAKVKAWNAGTYPGEECEQCGRPDVFLQDLPTMDGIRKRLCHDCVGRDHVRRQQMAVHLRCPGGE